MVIYYREQPISEPTTVVDFYRTGGVRFGWDPRDPGAGDFAASLIATTGGRAQGIPVGAYQAALVWSDPTNAVDLRTHAIYWSDGAREYFLVAYMSAEDIVNTARSIVCSAS